MPHGCESEGYLVYCRPYPISTLQPPTRRRRAARFVIFERQWSLLRWWAAALRYICICKRVELFTMKKNYFRFSDMRFLMYLYPIYRYLPVTRIYIHNARRNKRMSPFCLVSLYTYNIYRYTILYTMMYPDEELSRKNESTCSKKINFFYRCNDVCTRERECCPLRKTPSHLLLLSPLLIDL